MTGRTLFEKVWSRNIVSEEREDQPAILHVGLHLIHEVTSPQAFTELDRRGVKVRRPDLTLATMDHSTPTLPADQNGNRVYATEQAARQVERLIENCHRHGIKLHDFDSPQRGIVHIIGPELGRIHPGSVVVCGDSHTSTHGAFGALAFGIGTTEVGHVLATQCLFQRRPKTMRVNFQGRRPAAVTAKDLALKMIATLGIGGATGHVIEYAGNVIRTMSMEERMTLCNLSIEAGARAGMIAPDQITFDYLSVTPGIPEDRQAAITEWSQLYTDSDAVFDHEIDIDISSLAPMVTYGTSPDTALSIGQSIPAETASDQSLTQYMGLEADQSLTDLKVDRVFIGSCTNGRLSDLRAAAQILYGHRVADHVTMLVVPGSETVKAKAEEEGLDKIFIAAGAEWREPGCSMCIAMNGDAGLPGERVVSTSNRNFKGRQGKGVRTILASPATAAASAIRGVVTDPRVFTKEIAA